MDCPSLARWAAYASGSVDEREVLAAHAASCDRCRQALTGLALAHTTVAQTEAAGPPPRTALLAPGTHVGRYVIERELGVGGMGVVYIARDPELDRKVAIKLLRLGLSSDQLRREAKALAKLDHPNVVAVYDVGEHDGQVFVAMSLVEGRTLREWRKKRRSTGEAIRVIVEAGRGIAAAHAAGLVHRDLKPDNVFVSDRGQVLVGDFGLARSIEERDHDSVIAGTPAYMAPEQIRGEATEASDQFALCVTAWETLYDTRPFLAGTVEQTLDAVTRGAIVDPPRDRRVSNRVRRALERGLAADPAARWPSIDALLVELSGERLKRRRIVVLAVAGVALVLAGAWGVTRLARSSVDRCRSADERLADVWTPARSVEIRDAVVRVAPYARTSIDHALTLLDAYATRWRTSWDTTCRAEASDTGFDLRVACLEQRLRVLASTADALRGVDADSARHVIDAAGDLPALERCDDIASLRKVAPPPSGIAARVAAVERDLATGDGLTRASRFRDAGPILERAQREADALGYTPTQARAELASGTLHNRQGHFTEAKPYLERALNHAIAASDDEVTARSYLAQAYTMVGLSEAPRAKELTATAAASVHRIGDPPDLSAKLEVLGVSVPILNGNFVDGLATIDRVIPKLEANHHHREAMSLYRLHSALLVALGRIDDARAAFDHEVEAYRELLGTNHPDYAAAQVARGAFLLGHERYPEAIADLTAGYKTLVDSLGLDDVTTIDAGTTFARVDTLFGRADEAIAKLRRAAASADQHGGAQARGIAHRQLAQALVGAGKIEDGERELALATELDRTVAGPYRLADDLVLAQLRVIQHRVAEARALSERLRPALEKQLGADNPALADLWILEADIAVAEHRDADAVGLLNKVTGMALADAKSKLAAILDRQGDKAGAIAARRIVHEQIDKIAPDARPDLRAVLAK